MALRSNNSPKLRGKCSSSHVLIFRSPTLASVSKREYRNDQSMYTIRIAEQSAKPNDFSAGLCPVPMKA